MASHDPRYFETAARVVMRMINQLQVNPLPQDTILNINVPDLAYEDLSGLRVTRLGHRHKAEPVIKTHDPRGRDIYWVGPPGGEQDAGEGTDFHAVRNGYVSITPIQIDLTRHQALKSLNEWIAELADEH
jgi:5'-nucleotidase